MNPEDVPTELVDAGYAAMLYAGYRVVEDMGDQVPEGRAVRLVLAAVLSDIQAQALRTYAETWSDHDDSEVFSEPDIRADILGHAARLTEGNES